MAKAARLCVRGRVRGRVRRALASDTRPPSAQPARLGARVSDTRPPPCADAPEDPLLGVVLDERYKVLERIGEGGMGRVYRGRHVTLGKAIALKVLKGEFSSERDLTERFLREARAASRIGHENIVDIIDFGATPEGEAYFVMEYLAGRELESLLVEHGRLPWSRTRGILLQIAKAMEVAHRAGIVHRDMKPSNVFLIPRDGNPDYVKLFDFGIAKIEDMAGLTQAGMVFGTVAYMAPEQAKAETVDSRVDIYALGCIAFELLTGKLPFDDPKPHKILDMHIGDPVPSMRSVAPHALISIEVELAVTRAMAKDPDDRFPDMAGFARALAAVPAEASSGGPSPRRRPLRPQARLAPIEAREDSGSSSGLELEFLASLYVALADADGELGAEELELLVARLCERTEGVSKVEVGRRVRHAHADWRAAPAAEHRAARLRMCARELRGLLPRPELAAVLADLYEIAGVDARVPDVELRLIIAVTQELDLSPDPRLLATAFLYLTVSHADGKLDPKEQREVVGRLRTWAPRATEAEVCTVLHWASAEFARRGDRQAQLECAREAADQLRMSAGDDALRRILADLWRIAGADGEIAVEERRFIMDIVERFKAAPSKPAPR